MSGNLKGDPTAFGTEVIETKSDQPRDYATTLRSFGQMEAADALETMRSAEAELEGQIMSIAIDGDGGDTHGLETLKSQYRISVEESVAANEQLQKAGMDYVRVTQDEYATLSYQDVETSYVGTKEHIEYMSPRIMDYRPWRQASDGDAGVAADVASSQAMTMDMETRFGPGARKADCWTATQPHGTKRRWEPGSDVDGGDVVYRLKL